MKLIDGEIQSKRLINYILERKETFARALEKGDNDFIFAMLMDYFDEQPTAYDVDKVVEQLETARDGYSTAKLMTVTNNELVKKFIAKEKTINLAIKIVKDGGIC